MKKLRRYNLKAEVPPDVYGTNNGFAYIKSLPAEDGEWIRYDELKPILISVRENIRKNLAKFQYKDEIILFESFVELDKIIDKDWYDYQDAKDELEPLN